MYDMPSDFHLHPYISNAYLLFFLFMIIIGTIPYIL